MRSFIWLAFILCERIAKFSVILARLHKRLWWTCINIRCVRAVRKLQTKIFRVLLKCWLRNGMIQVLCALAQSLRKNVHDTHYMEFYLKLSGIQCGVWESCLINVGCERGSSCVVVMYRKVPFWGQKCCCWWCDVTNGFLHWLLNGLYGVPQGFILGPHAVSTWKKTYTNLLFFINCFKFIFVRKLY